MKVMKEGNSVSYQIILQSDHDGIGIMLGVQI